jgi:hypothetical protein
VICSSSHFVDDCAQRAQRFVYELGLLDELVAVVFGGIQPLAAC